jgi:hypothetical protein
MRKASHYVYSSANNYSRFRIIENRKKQIIIIVDANLNNFTKYNEY